MDEEILLVCTVGGRPEPIVAAIKHYQPQRVLFIPSEKTMHVIESEIIPKVRQEGLELSSGKYEIIAITKEEDLTRCLEEMRSKLKDRVNRWINRGENYHAVFDFTGGTKCMTAALTLACHQWRCRFSYVGGTERTNNDVGVVVEGTEHVLRCPNPWDALGYEAVDDAMALFDKHDYAAAADLLDKAISGVSDEKVRKELSTFKLLSEAYDYWEKFRHGDASGKLKKCSQNANDFKALFHESVADMLRNSIKRHIEYLNGLYNLDTPSMQKVYELVSNALRRESEKRWDDAVARLYRATEALAQVRLKEQYGIENTGKVNLDDVPASLRLKWANRAENGYLKLGVQDAYLLLKEFGDELGARFSELKWDTKHSILTSRNQSILAHGFRPVSESTYNEFRDGFFRLSGIAAEDLPRFPTLETTW